MLCSPNHSLFLFFKTWKKREKCKKNGKNQKANQQNPKNTKAKIKGKKREKKERQKAKKKGKKWTCPFAFFLHLFCFFDLLFCCFCVAFILFFLLFSSKMQMDKSIFFQFFPLFDVPFFPIYFASCFFGFEVLLFDFPCVFLFFCIFSSLKKH